MTKFILTSLLVLSTSIQAKEFLSGNIKEPSPIQQYKFNQLPLSQACNKLKEQLGADNVTLSTGSNKKFYNRFDNECIVQNYPGNFTKYQNTKLGTNSFLNK
jgi:hypothetical protein